MIAAIVADAPKCFMLCKMTREGVFQNVLYVRHSGHEAYSMRSGVLTESEN